MTAVNDRVNRADGRKFPVPHNTRIWIEDRGMAGLLNALTVMAVFSSVDTVFTEDSSDFHLRVIQDMDLTPNAYKITVNQDRAEIACRDYSGGINALATLLAMTEFRDGEYYQPQCEIYDYPDAEFRSLLLDPARKYIPIKELEDTAILMAKCRMNRLHLHLSDSAYYSIRSEIIPGLNDNSYQRYSLEEMRSFVAFASVLGIDVIPEIEMPAHAQFFVERIPGLQCRTDSKNSSSWVMCVSSEETYRFIDEMFEELASVFHYSHIHIGTDELMFKDLSDLRYWPEWENCSSCRDYCTANHIKDSTELFYSFIRRVYAIAAKHDRKLIMWNDGIDISRSPDLPRDILIQFWRIAMKHRGPYEGCTMERFLEEGFSVVNSFYPETYIDLYMSEDGLGQWTPLLNPPSKPEYHHAIIGSEICAWEAKPHYERTLPAGITAFAYKIWDYSKTGFDDAFQQYQSRVLLGAKCPAGFNLAALFGTAFLPLDGKKIGIIKNIRVPDEIFLSEIGKLELASDGSSKYMEIYRKVLKNIYEEKKNLKTMTYSEFLDKVEGCWFGKNLGGAGGVAKEGVKERMKGIDFKEIMNTELPNDDLDLQIMWLQALEEKGPYLDTKSMAALWKASCSYPWSEYGYFMKNYKRGILPPTSGWFNNEFFKDGMGCPIRSEIWAVAYAGMPLLALEKAKMDGSIDHASNAMWGEAFLAALESMLFVNTGHLAAIRSAIGMIDKETRVYACITRIVQNYEKGMSFDHNLDYVMANYSHPDFTNSTQNIAIAIMAVLYGELDMERTINLALSGGYDADCTCATAGSIVGIITGISAIPQNLKDLINDRYVVGVDIQRKNNSIHTFAEDCAKIGLGILKHFDSDLFQVVEIPEEIVIPAWSDPQQGTVLNVTYCGLPAIGSDDECSIIIELDNTHCGDPLQGIIRIDGLPEGWLLANGEIRCEAAAYATVRIPAVIRTSALDRINQTNLLKAVLVNGDNTGIIAECMFGIAGKAPYRMYGPFFSSPNWRHNPSWPHCHGGADLPPIVAMVHNEVLLDNEYCDEKALRENPENYTANLIGTIYAAEDVIPIQENIGISGECGFILIQDVIMPEACEGWIMAGNTDAFRINLNGTDVLTRDQSIYWTPINNAVLCQFSKGRNRLMIKLLRRTDNVKFSLGIKESNNKHYHQVFWRDDLAYHIFR